MRLAHKHFGLSPLAELEPGAGPTAVEAAPERVAPSARPVRKARPKLSLRAAMRAR